MRRVGSWALWAVTLATYVLIGRILGWQVDTLTGDLFPLLVGAAAGLVMDSVRDKENEA
jgi:hypothetical protein